MPLRKVIISGGGTGGHIFPAIAIANAIRKKYPDSEILFVGAKGRMEMEKVPQAGYNIIGLWISGLQRKFTARNILFPFKVISSSLKAMIIVRRFKPDVVIGTGGYASWPVLNAAARRGIPTIIQEQNSHAGLSNRKLAKKVSRICVAFDGMENYFPKEKIVMTGNPVREEVVKLQGKKERGAEFFRIEPTRKTVLIVGGSLGARSINIAMQHCLPKLQAAGYQVIWQTGKNFLIDANAFVTQNGCRATRVYDFITKMDYAYAMASVVVSRAGAIAVSELCLAGIPTILIPSPNVAEDHQTKNAEALANRGAAILIKDNEANEKLGDTILDLLKNDEKRNKLTENMISLAMPQAAERIVAIADELVNK